MAAKTIALSLAKVLIQVLPFVIGWVDDYFRERQIRKRAEEREKIRDNPYNYMRDRYNRVRDPEDRDGQDSGPAEPAGHRSDPQG